MKTSDLDFELPAHLIATEAAEPRDAAKLLLIQRQTPAPASVATSKPMPAEMCAEMSAELSTDAPSHPTTSHHHIRDLPSLDVLQPGDLMIVNQTRVLPACFSAKRAATGGKMQGLFLGQTSSTLPSIWQVLLESRGKLQVGETVELDEQASLKLLASTGPGQWDAQLITAASTSPSTDDNPNQQTLQTLHRVGSTPLPPYIRKARKKLGQAEIRPDDAARYNTIFSETTTTTTAAAPNHNAGTTSTAATHATTLGSVAAPTAGLHFTPELIQTLENQGIRRAAVTLHVGMGTFAPVKTESLDDHVMHQELYEVSQQTIEAIKQTKAQGGRVLCVGTTSVRALESLPEDILDHPRNIQATSQLFIKPGFEFRFVDMLLTNFHLPQSTLLALVSALPNLGLDALKDIYAQAIAHDYRFFSYGDAMLIA